MNDVNTHVPLYIQVKSHIIDKINDGTFKPGDKIYSENELKEKFNISSTTVVKALNELVNEGYLERIQGRGSFVSTPKLQRTPSNLSITEELRSKGINLQTRLLEVEEVIEPEIAAKLDLSKETILCKIIRLRYIQKNDSIDPIVLQVSYIPNHFVTMDDLKLFEVENSLYDILFQTRNLKPYRAKETYSIHLINNKNVAALLDQKLGDPAFEVKRITYTEDDVPFEYAESFLRWDRYTIEVDLYDTKQQYRK